MNNEQYNEFIRRIRLMRKNKNITQSELARRISVTPTAYCRMEKGKTQISVVTLCMIAQALDISPRELLK